MSMVNISLVGNLVRSPEQFTFQSGKVKTNMVVAVNSIRSSADKEGVEQVDYYKVETWGRTAENAAKYLDKGNQVTVHGKLSIEYWTDKEGKERFTFVVTGHQISFPQRGSRSGRSDNASKDGHTTQRDTEIDFVQVLPDDDLFEGARTVSVAEPRAHYTVQSERKKFNTARR